MSKVRIQPCFGIIYNFQNFLNNDIPQAYDDRNRATIAMPK